MIVYEKPQVANTVKTRTVLDLFAPVPVQGEVGAEFELEGVDHQLREMLQPKGFDKHIDGSLNGLGIEMVFNGPKERKLARECIEGLFKDIHPKWLNNSDRCSTHFHVNVQRFTMQQVILLASLYYIFEDIFFDVHGVRRKGNAFCVRYNECESIRTDLIQALVAGRGFHRMTSDESRYAALNFSALRKFGSVEFRSHAGVNKASEAIEWMDVILELYDYAAKNLNLTPAQFFDDLSKNGHLRFFERDFPTLYAYVKNVPRLTEKYWEGLHHAQELAYALKWNHDPKEVKETIEYKAHVGDDWVINVPPLPNINNNRIVRAAQRVPNAQR